MSAPSISVVMSVLDAESTVGPALTSLLTQSVVDLEVLVFDDGSTDGTAAVLDAVQDPRVRRLSLGRNVGRAHGRDLAVRAARSEIVAIADADDVSLPRRLESHLDVLDRHPAAVATCGRLRLVSDGRARVDTAFPSDALGVDAAFRRGQMPVAHPASAFRRDWYLETGGYDHELRWCEDYDLFARGWRPGLIVPGPEVVVDYSVSGCTRSWDYWWQNERHRRAVNDRIVAVGRSDAGRHSIAPHLEAASRPPWRALEVARWSGVTLRDAWRGRSRHVSGAP